MYWEKKERVHLSSKSRTALGDTSRDSCQTLVGWQKDFLKTKKEREGKKKRKSGINLVPMEESWAGLGRGVESYSDLLRPPKRAAQERAGSSAEAAGGLRPRGSAAQLPASAGARPRSTRLPTCCAVQRSPAHATLLGLQRGAKEPTVPPTPTVKFLHFQPRLFKKYSKTFLLLSTSDRQQNPGP